MPLPHQDSQVESPNQPGKLRAALTSPQTSSLRHRLAAFDTAELDEARWQNRFMRFVYFAAILVVFMTIGLVNIPRHSQGL